MAAPELTPNEQKGPRPFLGIPAESTSSSSLNKKGRGGDIGVPAPSGLSEVLLGVLVLVSCEALASRESQQQILIPLLRAETSVPCAAGAHTI